MPIRRQQALSNAYETTHSRHSSCAAAVLAWLIGELTAGELTVEIPNGSVLRFAGRPNGLRARIHIHNWRVLVRVMMGWDIGFAESYMAGEWSTPDLAALLKLIGGNSDLEAMPAPLRGPWPALKLRHAFNRNTPRGSRKNIAAHYDLGNAFYEQWLDAGMSYSSGIYATPAMSLDEAQQAKLDRIAELLALDGGEKVLEIGCGWGGLVEYLVRKRGVHVTGVTLSREQLVYAQARLETEVEAGRCELLLRDYREVAGTYDRIVSIEMLEAVGVAYWPVYFSTLRDRLAAGGSAVLQVITIAENRFEAYRRRPDFIQKYIFPGGMLPTKEIIAREAQSAGLRLVHTEFFGPSYGRTLQDWRARFLARWPQIGRQGFDERFRRMWEFYMAYCEAGFDSQSIDVGLYRFEKG